jgi:probable metal-binding protein
MSTNTAEASIHGHEVIALIAAANPPLTRATLAEQVRQHFGPDARFHTCSPGAMTLTELLSFLAQRGKLVETPAGELSFVRGQACDHG